MLLGIFLLMVVLLELLLQILLGYFFKQRFMTMEQLARWWRPAEQNQTLQQITITPLKQVEFLYKTTMVRMQDMTMFV
jgi:uncharacterized protein YneF (UPF0154 family)